MEIWKILWLLIVLVTTSMMIYLMAPDIGNVVDIMVRQDATYTATEISGLISLVGAGPDGTQQLFELPKKDAAGCIKIFQTRVDVSIPSSTPLPAQASSDIVEGAAPVNVRALADAKTGDTFAEGDWDSIKITCSKSQRKWLVIIKQDGKINFRMQ